jgi:ubiquinone/menaquinone biosynthesis C-methylase UbiE
MTSSQDKREQQQTWTGAIDWWRTYAEMEARLTAAVSERMLDLAGLAPGMRVLDIASGSGEPALAAARRLGLSGHVLATDLIPAVLELAKERATRAGLTNVEFRVADAESLEVPEASFDVATLRWGLMYIPDAAAALARIRRALKPGGVLVIAAWAAPEQVSFTLPRRILARHREMPPVAPDAPAVSRYGDPGRLRTVLDTAGFHVDTEDAMDTPVVEASDGAGIVDWALRMGGSFAALVNELPPPARRAWEADLVAAAEKHRDGDRVVLGGTTWLVLARR